MRSEAARGTGTRRSLIEPVQSDRGEDGDLKVIYEYLNGGQEECRESIGQANYVLLWTTGYLALHSTELNHLLPFHVV